MAGKQVPRKSRRWSIQPHARSNVRMIPAQASRGYSQRVNPPGRPIRGVVAGHRDNLVAVDGSDQMRDEVGKPWLGRDRPCLSAHPILVIGHHHHAPFALRLDHLCEMICDARTGRLVREQRGGACATRAPLLPSSSESIGIRRGVRAALARTACRCSSVSYRRV